MSKLIICNDATEQMLGENLEPAQFAVSANSAWRHVWFARENDVVVLPAPLNKDFLSYMGEVLGADMKNIQCITPKCSFDSPAILSDKELLSDKVVNDLKKTMSLNGCEMVCYYYSLGIVRLAEKLGLKPPSGAQFASQNGPDILNRKSIFRRLSAGNKLPIAVGGVAYNAETLNYLINKCILETNSVIIKQDRNAGGEGNIVVTNTNEKCFPGANKVLKFDKDSMSQSNTIWDLMLDPSNQELVVESYYNAKHILYSEYRIEEDGETTTFLNNGTLRMEPIDIGDGEFALQWHGFEMPATLPPHSAARLSSACTKWAKLCADLGYRGMVNIDSIVTSDDKIIINEVNGRMGGCSHIHHVAETVLGKNYGDHYFINTRINVQAPDFNTLINSAPYKGMLFDRSVKRGVIVLVNDNIFTNTIQYMIISDCKEDLDLRERAFIDALEAGCAEK